jgi:hypothetical protein
MLTPCSTLDEILSSVREVIASFLSAYSLPSTSVDFDFSEQYEFGDLTSLSFLRALAKAKEKHRLSELSASLSRVFLEARLPNVEVINGYVNITFTPSISFESLCLDERIGVAWELPRAMEAVVYHSPVLSQRGRMRSALYKQALEALAATNGISVHHTDSLQLGPLGASVESLPDHEAVLRVNFKSCTGTWYQASSRIAKELLFEGESYAGRLDLEGSGLIMKPSARCSLAPSARCSLAPSARWYYADSTPLSECEPWVPYFDERANLFWFLGRTIDRLSSEIPQARHGRSASHNHRCRYKNLEGVAFRAFIRFLLLRRWSVVKSAPWKYFDQLRVALTLLSSLRACLPLTQHSEAIPELFGWAVRELKKELPLFEFR